MIRQNAFMKTGNSMLKGALHCHTKRSDGHGTPEEVIRLHKQNGYDFMAITDHRIYNYENFAPETDIIIVPGMEMDCNLPECGNGRTHCFHAVSIGPSRQDGNGFSQDQRFESSRATSQEEFQPILDMLHASNNMTVYCHPEWSSTPARDFERLQGNFAMEIWNSGCAMENDMDTDAAYWDELLRRGIRIFGVATDDGHKMDQHCNGWVRVNAAPDLNSILAALKSGSFYASCGPEIYDFFLDDAGRAVVDCSAVNRIRFHYGYAPTRIVRAQDAPVTHGEFALSESYSYVRASVVDDRGRIAWTNPIFLD